MKYLSYKYLLISPLIIFIVSCSSLSKTQIRMCDKYFSELNDYNMYANEINSHIANVKYSRKKLIAASLDSNILIMDVLDSAIRNYENDITMPFDLRKSLMDFSCYSAGYSFKSSYNTDFLKNFKTFLVEYIPFGVGNIIYEIVYATRKVIIKPNIGKKVKKHVQTGDELILSNTNTLSGIYNNYLIELSAEEMMIKDTYQKFLEKVKIKPDSWERYTMFNPVFIENFSEMYYTQQMINNLLLATSSLDSAQVELTKLTRKRKRIKTQNEKLNDFYVGIAGIRKSSGLLNRVKE